MIILAVDKNIWNRPGVEGAAPGGNNVKIWQNL